MEGRKSQGGREGRRKCEKEGLYEGGEEEGGEGLMEGRKSQEGRTIYIYFCTVNELAQEYGNRKKILNTVP